MAKVVHKYPGGHEIVTFTSQWACEGGHENEASLMGIEVSEECGKGRISAVGDREMHHCFTCDALPTQAGLEEMLRDIYRQVIRDRYPGTVVFWRSAGEDGKEMWQNEGGPPW